MKFLRVQDAGIPFSALQAFTSADGGDDLACMGGLCACDSVSALLRNTAIEAYGPDRPAEVVIFTGRILARIYDGYRVEPIRELARYPLEEFRARADEIAWDWEL